MIVCVQERRISVACHAPGRCLARLGAGSWSVLRNAGREKAGDAPALLHLDLMRSAMAVAEDMEWLKDTLRTWFCGFQFTFIDSRREARKVKDLGDAGCAKGGPREILLGYHRLEADDVAADQHETETEGAQLKPTAHVEADRLEKSDASVAGTLLKRLHESGHHRGKSVPEPGIVCRVVGMLPGFAPLWRRIGEIRDARLETRAFLGAPVAAGEKQAGEAVGEVACQAMSNEDGVGLVRVVALLRIAIHGLLLGARELLVPALHDQPEIGSFLSGMVANQAERKKGPDGAQKLDGRSEQTDVALGCVDGVHTDLFPVLLWVMRMGDAVSWIHRAPCQGRPGVALSLF